MDEAQLLHARLHRVVLALTLTEDLISDLFERLAEQGGVSADERRLLAKRSRAAAEQCRTFAARLAEIRDVDR
jgi:hypothetical protein